MANKINTGRKYIMQKKHILKAFSLLAAVCVTAGCNGSTTAETTTKTTTAEITTVTEQSIVTTEDVGETNGIKYCEIPEGMTFEDLCGFVYYKDTQLHFPCTIDEILALNENWKTDKNYGVDGDKSSTIIYEVDEDGNEQPCFIVGTYSEGSLENFEDVSTQFAFGTTMDYAFSDGGLSFAGIKGGDSVAEVEKILGEASEEYEDGCCYSYIQNDMELLLTFDYNENNFTSMTYGIWRKENE